MKTFIRILLLVLFSVGCTAVAHNFLSPSGLRAWQEILSWISIPGFILIGWQLNDWRRKRQNMTFTYIKRTDSGMLYMRNVNKQKERVYIRSEIIAEGITFNYDRDSGELWAIHVRGINKKDEEDKK